jgi:NAD(P)-dependent dehydrogenase (short-subunit alcohol dehydrogenase family)
MSIDSLKDKSFVVTGAASGIGAATAARLAREGAMVTAVDLSWDYPSEAAPTESERVIRIAADVSDPVAVNAFVVVAVERFGSLAGVHLNAGHGTGFASLVDCDPAEYERTMRVNAGGCFYGMQAAIRQMLKQGGGGSVVATSSSLGIRGGQGQAPYTASKHAIIGLVRTAALEYAHVGIRVNALCPGFVRSGMLREMETELTGSGDSAELQAEWAKIVPAQRLSDPPEQAAMVVWLLSDEASYVTGESFAVDGGLTIGTYGGPMEIKASDA